MNEARYFVWRRNDGFVAATRYPVRNYKGSNGEETTFVDLGDFATWPEALAAIEAAKVDSS
ncbi:MAG: hypothetical protein EPN91_03555 [Salinibacterium sp.]|nr:MAG: hypothetical protein EPN91_03555 [Salinibacterium sp.]